jgi:drug/metabolite transporter (DMT)-like permease
MRIAWLYLLLCVTIWGWTFVATKLCLKYLDPVELLAVRLVIGVPFLWLVVAAKKIRLTFGSKDRKAILLAAAIIVIHLLIQAFALKYTSATNTGWIIGVTPLVMAVMAFFILKERLSRMAIFGVVIATVGIVLLVSRGNMASLNWFRAGGDWLILISTHTWALYTIVVRNITRAHHPLAVTFAVLIPGTIVMLFYLVIRSDWSRIIAMPLEGYLAMAFLSILGLAVAHWFWQEGVARIGATRSGIFLYLEPLATTALAVPLLGEQFGLLTGAGGLLVLAGVYIAQRTGLQKAPA